MSFLKVIGIRNVKIVSIFIISFLILFSSIAFQSNKSFSSKSNEFQKIQISGEELHTTQWLKNNDFTNGIDHWYNKTEGDKTDINATFNDGAANFEVMGNNGSYSLIMEPQNESNWTTRLNPDLPAFPEWFSEDSFWINEDGFFARHQWEEGPIQNPSVQWVHEVEMHNMYDYIITSATISANINATVDRNIDVNQSFGDIPEGSNSVSPQGVIYDYVRFYIQIADPEFENIYEIASYKTNYLGLWIDGWGGILDFKNITNSEPEEDLMFYLTSVLSKDNANFTLIVGIDIFCEDNCRSDVDTWDLLCINSLNLTFAYEKKIDQFTSVSWNQDSDKIDDISKYNIAITNAILNFKYKIDQNWHESSPNSELKILINNVRSTETIKLIDYNYTSQFQDAKLGGFDVKSLISENENINLSIQLSIADNFALNKLTKITIDNIVLDISYVEYIPIKNESILIMWWIISILLIITSLLGAISLRSYVFVPRKIKKKNNLLLRTQKFKDADNIQGILLIHSESGLPIYSKNYSDLMKGMNTLFSGFLQAISVVGEEISRKKSHKTDFIQIDNKMSFQKVVEFDFKHFFCLILDMEELRTVLILKNKSSKRLKTEMFHFAVSTYLKFSDTLKNWDNSLDIFKREIPPLLNNFFNLYYKEAFKIAVLQSDLQKLKKELNLHRREYKTMNDIYTISEENRHFKIMNLLEKMTGKSEDIIIDAIEGLINHKLIIPVN
ncbi:MAG: hypothetical protein ACW96X_10165 [Promethearchaeota archaeon]